MRSIMLQIKDPINDFELTLQRELKLKEPSFRLETVGKKVGGSIISDSFRGMRDSYRQKLIWDALDKAYGEESIKVGLAFLAFTPDEWNIDEDD